ncbi:MAG: hypothetical protein JKY28_05620 [Sulfurimonas sp.]|nr:hypothetical protein [Sulfurimonas sp.]
MQQIPKPDKFEERLLGVLETLQDCQVKQGVKTCSDCKHFLSCDLRTDYIKSVYNSMSKGDTGGFEF